MKPMKIMGLGHYYHLFVNYHVAAESLKPLIPQGLELDLFEGKGIVSWVASTWQDLKVLGWPWVVPGPAFSLTLRTYVKKNRGTDWVRGYFPIESWMSDSKYRWCKNICGLEKPHPLELKRSVHFEPHEKSSRGIFEYSWKKLSEQPEQLIRFRTIGSPQPAMAGYLEYFTSEKNQFFLKRKDKLNCFLEERAPWVIWELDEIVLPTQWPSQMLANLDWTQPESTFVVKGGRVVIKSVSV
ncbi:MAG: hypothetical protein EBR01_05345 [Proteobacteria bacterium]|nr:hypothetical protein [Pseudomonadota bacterium]